VRAFCPTWPPAAHSANNLSTNERRKLNAWILNSGECDDVVDWDAVLRGAAVEDAYDPAYFSDGIHPNPAGHQALADATPLRWFRYAPTATAAATPASTTAATGTTETVAASSSPSFASDLGLPATRRCVSRRHFPIRIRVPRGQRLRSARVYVNGRRAISVRAGRRLTSLVDLRGLPRGTFKVKVVARTRSGRTFTRTRAYKTCTPRR
jgi:hypothetical protein